MFEKVVFLAFCRDIYRALIAALLCFIALFSSSFAAPQHWVKYRSYDVVLTRLLGGSNSGHDANGYTYESYNNNAWMANHRANLDDTYTVLDMIPPVNNTSAIRFSYYCNSGTCYRGPNTGGYHFTGEWRGNYKKDGTPGDEVYTPGETFTYKVDGDLILEAILKPNKYTVTYNCGSFSYNGYTTLNAIPTSQNPADYQDAVIFDQPYRLKTAQDVAQLCYPPAQGYVFKGWNCRGENWLYDGSYPISQYFNEIIGESGDHWWWGNVECSALWGPDSKSSVIHLYADLYNSQYPVTYISNQNASYNSALGRTELLGIKNTGVYIDLDAQYEMTPVGDVNGVQNPVAIPTIPLSPNNYFIGYFGSNDGYYGTCEGGECWRNGNRRYINSYGELLPDGEAAGISYDSDAVWFAGWANVKGSALVKLDSSNADMGYHGQEFLFFRPDYSCITQGNFIPCYYNCPTQACSYDGPYLDVDASTGSYTGLMTVGGNNRITVNPADFKRTGYLFAGYFSIPDPGPTATVQNIGTRYIDKDGSITQEGYNQTSGQGGGTGIWYAHWCPVGDYVVGEYGNCVESKGFQVTYNCSNGGLGITPEDDNGYNNDNLSGFVVTTQQSTCLPPLGKKFDKWNCGGTLVNAGGTFTIGADTTCTAVWVDANPCGVGYTPSSNSYSWLDDHVNENDIEDGTSSGSLDINIVPYGFDVHFDYFADFDLDWSCSSAGASASPLLADPLNNISLGANCWCGISRYKDVYGTVYSLTDTQWMFAQSYGTDNQCANNCETLCKQTVKDNAVFRRMMYMSVSSCEAETYTATYKAGSQGILTGTGVFAGDMTYGTDYTVRGLGTDTVNNESGVTAKTGYDFSYWLASNGLSYQEYDTLTSNSSSSDFSGPLTFTAQWTPQCNGPVTLDANKYNPSNLNNVLHSVSSSPSSVYIKYNSNWYTSNSCGTVATVTKPTLTGYTFGGYYTDKEGGGSRMTSATPALMTAGRQVTAAATWYAKWTPNTYTVTYDYGAYAANNATGTAYTHTNGATYDAIYTVPSNYTITPATGYTFVGWNTSSGQTTSNFPEIVPWTRTSGLTVYAAYDCDTGYQWNNGVCVEQASTYTLTYAAGNHGSVSGANDTEQVSGGSSHTLKSYTNAGITAGTGYNFNGWVCTKDNINENNGVTVTESSGTYSITMPNNNVTCTAQWAPKTYTISYGSGSHGSVPNNGTDPVAYANGLTYGSTWTTKTFAETGIVADTGYVFSGWNTSADGSGMSYQAGTLQSAWTTDSGLTLYAIYGCDTGYTMNSNNECVQQTCPEGESLNMLYDLNLFNPEGTLSGFGFDAYGTAFGDEHHDYLNDTPNTFGVWDVDQDEILLGSAMCSTDEGGLSPLSSLNVDSQNPEENKFCWCSLTGGVQNGAQYSLSPSTWLYLTGDLGPECEKYCAQYCAGLGEITYPGGYIEFIINMLKQEYCTPQPYKVSYYCDKQKWLDGEEPLSADTVFYGSSGYSFERPENTILAETSCGTPEGYQMVGFECYTATNENPVDDGDANPWTINEDVVCFASYAPDDFDITLNKINGSGGANKVYTTYNRNVYRNANRTEVMTTSANPITTPSKTGYNFMGYYASSGGNNQNPYIDANGYITQAGVNAGKALTANGGWWAHWTPKTYTISYGSGSHGSVPNNGADPVVFQDGLTYGSTWTTKTFAETGIVADTGYVFSGWNTSADGSGTSYTANTQQSAWTTDSGLILYAIYGCATGYTMNSNNECVQQVNSYNVIYRDQNQYDNTTVSVPTGTLHTVLGIGDTTITIPMGYVFDHWTCYIDSVHDYDPGDTFTMPNQDVVCRAVLDCDTGYAWNNAHTQCLKTYDVEYHACDSQYLDNNDATGLLTNIISMINPQYIWGYGGAGLKDIKTGYRFDTWLDANNTSYMNGWYQYDSNQNYYQINLDDNTSPLVLYAQCRPTQTNVRYYCGENMVYSNHATYDQSYTFYNNATACGPCATVTSWNCSYFSKQGTLSNMPYSGLHNVGQTVTWNDPMDDYGSEYGYDCVAVTQGNSYQIIYGGGTATNPNNPNSATHAVTTVAMSPQNVHYGDQNVTLNTNTYAQEGYDFDGWSCTATICDQQTSTTFTFDDEENIGPYKFGTNLVCAAQWTPKTYTVTYDYGAHAANNATGAAYTHTNGATYDANYTVPAAANAAITPATGYVFVGWNTSSGQTTANWTGATPWTQTTGLTVYAAYACDTANGYIESNDYPGVCVERLTVTYRSGAHGSGQDYVVVAGDGDEHELLDITDVGISAQNGYYFGGWQCDNGVTRGPGYNFVMNGSDVICVAQWTPNEIGLTWLLNSGHWQLDANENILSNQDSCDYGTLNGITVYDPVRRGFGFTGWNVEGVSGP